jgi:hypothetical protein
MISWSNQVFFRGFATIYSPVFYVWVLFCSGPLGSPLVIANHSLLGDGIPSWSIKQLWGHNVVGFSGIEGWIKINTTGKSVKVGHSLSSWVGLWYVSGLDYNEFVYTA